MTPIRDATEGIWEGGHSEVPAGGVGLAILEGGAGIGERFHDHRDDGGGHDADEQATADIADNHDATDDQTQHEDERGPRGQGAINAKAHGNGGVGGIWHATHKPGIHQANHGDEQANAHADGRLEGGGDGVEDCLAETSESQCHDDQTVDDHQAHGLWPGQPFGCHERDRYQRVDAQASGDTEGVLGDHAEQDGHDTRSEGGGSSHAGTTEDISIDIRTRADDQRVEDHDVGHREEGHHPGANLGGVAGATLGNVEVAV